MIDELESSGGDLIEVQSLKLPAKTEENNEEHATSRKVAGSFPDVVIGIFN
jgi:hypothetical protein